MNLYIKETNPENKETIIFIHSYNMAGWMWEEQVKAFNDYHCLVPDLPEHGKSKYGKPFTIEGAAERIINIIENQAHDGKAHLVGMSLGAQVILKILSTAPEAVGRTFISGTLVNTTKPSESFQKLLDYLLEVYIPVKNDKISIGSYIRSYGIPRNHIKKFKESTYVISEDSSDRIIRENLLFKRPEGLEKVNTPVLVMCGEKDYRVIKKSVNELLKVIPNSKGAVAAKAGHMWNMEKPELFNNILKAWINDDPLPDL
jgi:pimeloyl-ACP methyl ester carboxylesterase